MKLVVQVMGARDLPAMDLNGLSDPYVKVKLGKQKFKTRVVKKTLNPYWGEEFALRVDDLNDELLISVLDEDKYFNDDFVGCVKFPVSQVFDSHNKCLDTCWHPLQPKSKKPKHKDCGEILLNISFVTNNAFSDSASEGDHFGAESPSRSFVSETASPQRGKLDDKEEKEKEKSLAQKSLAGRLVQMFNKNPDVPVMSSTHSSKTDLTELVYIAEPTSEDHSASVPFDELMKTMQSREQAAETPENLPGGVLLDQMYVTEPKHLNTLLFSPGSTFPKALADLHGTTELEQGPWKFENDCLKRVVTYVKAASKLVKACKGTEDQQYLKADGKVFAVLASVNTPDVPYGKTFRTELLFCITPGPDLPSGEQCTRFVISWRMNFLQSTMMKGMIENGARQGLRDSYEQYATLLSQNVKPADSKDLGSNKDQVLASLQAEPQSDWKLAVQYFANFTVVSTFFIGFYMMVHIWLATPSTIQGLEFVGLDLPDSLGEFIVCGVLVLQGERVLGLISRFMQARVQKGSDHGVKAQGDGWLLTVALIEGSNIAAVDSTGFSDPYVVFSCNGKTRTSSIKFQKCNPMWNEIFEFDAMDEPPSVLDVEIYDFDGPFDEATSLGHAEINFVKTNISDLADLWIPLQGKLAQACQSKLHLRIFLNNTRGGNVVNHFINKMEKEVGKKITVRSPQTNSAFQKLFGLPPEEFLINDFTCHLKRKMPLQGRLFLSARIIGFHANLFGRKTKFFFLWEDIEDIHIVPPTLSSMGSPTIVMTLRQGRGMDARHGAKTQDEEGRLKFHFQSFVSFNVANRTIMALWKARSLSPEQKVQIIEEESEVKSLQTDESGSFLGLDDVSMSEVHSSSHAVPANFFVELFGGGDLDRRVMEKAGCLNYSHTPWESEKGDVYVRQIYYRYDKRVSQYRGEVTSTQQKSGLSDKNGWLFQEVMTLHAIPLGDYFNVHIRYQIEDTPPGCQVKVSFGIEWLKSTKHQKRITKNVLKNLQDRLKVSFAVVEKEFTTR
ncbi:hypothetical protein ACLB2K_027587 [Fragaria x ananassa]